MIHGFGRSQSKIIRPESKCHNFKHKQTERTQSSRNQHKYFYINRISITFNRLHIGEVLIYQKIFLRNWSIKFGPFMTYGSIITVQIQRTEI